MIFTGQITKPTVSKHWRKPVGRQISGLNPTRTTPPWYNNTTLGNRVYAQCKGPNVTNPICLTCKNCSYKCAADCEHCVTQSNTAVLIIFPLNLQTIGISRILSSGGEGTTCLLKVGCFIAKSSYKSSTFKSSSSPFRVEWADSSNSQV